VIMSRDGLTTINVAAFSAARILRLLVTQPEFRAKSDRLIDSLGQPVVSLRYCDAHPPVAVVDCAGLSPPRAPSCFPVM
jgi:hypothetical protein